MLPAMGRAGPSTKVHREGGRWGVIGGVLGGSVPLASAGRLGARCACVGGGGGGTGRHRAWGATDTCMAAQSIASSCWSA